MYKYIMNKFKQVWGKGGVFQMNKFEQVHVWLQGDDPPAPVVKQNDRQKRPKTLPSMYLCHIS